ncbi:hypothetical protein TRICI_004110 [Trichomonascus ciferrii]|uniref:NAD-dependent epimerase/dehydratase domain-containing protein n=1 Tax=Trichomonascus ciferrii TaxID=44093 RepID=A0A642V842_9ASCO|nr:hypothetical protein TRICI_004110 [Trichomonascus ciferrii]
MAYKALIQPLRDTQARMTRVVIIGGNGHVGSYLVPALVERGYEVVNVSRGTREPYRRHSAWEKVENVVMDRKADEASGNFGAKIAGLEPDIVVDMISFTLPSTQQLVEALRGKIEHYLFCSTIWVYGSVVSIPSTEDDVPNPIDSYGRGKAECEAWLLHQARVTGFPATCFRPGHIVGEGWVPVNPTGNLDPEVFSVIARGEELTLPNMGLELLHHVHADDIARWVCCAMDNRAMSIGEAFNTVSSQAVNIRGYAETAYRWFGHEPRIVYKPFEEWVRGLGEYAQNTRSHLIRGCCHSIEKSRKRIGYEPRYTSLEAIKESVMALAAAGKI